MLFESLACSKNNTVKVESGGRSGVGGKGERGDMLNSRGINVKPKNMYK